MERGTWNENSIGILCRGVCSLLTNFFGFKKRILILVLRDKLAKQAAKQLKKWNPDATVGVEMGKLTSL